MADKDDIWHPNYDQYKVCMKPELGYTSPQSQRYKYRLLTSITRESDTSDPALHYSVDAINWKPELEKDRSGKDYEHRDPPTGRLRAGISTRDYQKRLYESDPTIQRILSKWHISPEHPGLWYRDGGGTGMGDYNFKPPWQHGIAYFHNLGLFRRLGPSYLDKPEGEACFSKSLALTKWGIVFGAWTCLYNVAFQNPTTEMREILSRFGKHVRIPATLGFLYGSSSCLSCSYRKKDDWKNHGFAGSVCGFAMGLMRGQPYGAWFGAVVLGGLASLFKISTEADFAFWHGNNFPPEVSGLFPESWKHLQMADPEIKGVHFAKERAEMGWRGF